MLRLRQFGGEGSKPHVQQGAAAKSKPYVQQGATAKSKPHVQQGETAKAKFHMPDSVRGLAHMGKTIPREPKYFRALLASINKLHIRDGKMEWGLTQEMVWINLEENEFASGAMRDAFKVTVERGCSCIKEDQLYIYVGKRVKGGENNAKVLKRFKVS